MRTISAPSAIGSGKLRNDEVIGLAIAVVAHVAIIAGLAIHAMRAPALIPEPPRVVVSLAQDVGLEATAPQIAVDAKASIADTIGDAPAPPEPVVEKPAPPKPVPPKPVPPKPVPPKPVPAKPKPAPPKPVPPKADKKPVVPPRSAVAAKPKPVAKPQPVPVATPKKAGGSRIGDNFLDGKGSNAAADAPIPASQIGSAEKASLAQAIAREIKPQWQGRSPQGLDADKLVTVLSFSLNQDGTLSGTPKVVRQDGINDSNRAQAGRHAEIAISSVQRAAPFNLPKEYYEAWKKVSAFRFDRNLSQ